MTSVIFIIIIIMYLHQEHSCKKGCIIKWWLILGSSWLSLRLLDVGQAPFWIQITFTFWFSVCRLGDTTDISK